MEPTETELSALDYDGPMFVVFSAAVDAPDKYVTAWETEEIARWRQAEGLKASYDLRIRKLTGKEAQDIYKLRYIALYHPEPLGQVEARTLMWTYVHNPKRSYNRASTYLQKEDLPS